MKSEDAEHGNAGWINGRHREAVWRRCVLMSLSAFVCAFILFAALPAYAYGTGLKESTDHHTLEIYGNANEDDTIDMRDVTYIKLVIFGKKPETKFCDANYDGRVSMLDVVQTKLIIVGKEAKLTIVDSANRIVTVEKPIDRVVSFSALPVETMRSIKAIDKVVGVGESMINDIFFPEFSEQQSIGTVFSPDYERILELQPDLVFLYAGSPESKFWSRYEEIQNTIESAGITVVRIDLKGTETNVYVEEVKKLGYILDKEEEAQEFIDFYLNWMNTINERIRGLSEEDKPKVYYESYRAPYKVYGGGDRGRKVEAAGGKNIFSDLPDFTEVDPEEVIKRDPEIILKMVGKIPGGWFGGGYPLDKGDVTIFKTVREEIMSRPELQNVTAVREGKVYIIAYSIIYSRPFIGIGYLAKWFHPELFKDLDPKAIHQEYLTRFQGLDIDLDEKGVFVYPEPS